MEKKHKISHILFLVAAWFLAAVGLLMSGIGIAESVVDCTARVLPRYPKEDIGAVVGKKSWSEEDYDFLYHQTGLAKPALEKMIYRKQELYLFQESFFHEGEIRHEPAAFTSPHDYIPDYFAQIAPLEKGDVLVTSSCHTFGWRNGHAAIVVDAEYGIVVESNTPGVESTFGTTGWFRQAPNFLVLRLKDASAEERAKIARFAEEHLISVPYSLTVGIFTEKDLGNHITETNCSHLVWQAYKHFGYDIDSDGGAICTSKDIANYEGFELVQVYGFDPDKLW